MKKKVFAAVMAGAMALTGTACSSAKAASTTVAAHNGTVANGMDSYMYCETTTCGEWEYSEAEDGEIYGNEDFNTEEYNTIKENGFVSVAQSPLSTFAADVDTGSYCNLRRMINDGWGLENVASSIRTEEMINYFDYTVENEDDVFSVQYSVGDCPWNKDNKLLVLTMQANSEINVPNEGNNFVFLIDTSGSMSSDDKLKLAVESFKLLAGTLGPKDRVSIVTYSGSSETVLVGSNDYKKICKALDKLKANGGTNGSGGINAAYKCAEENFIKNGNNRVIIASDGDMNLGITSQSGLVDLIKEKKETGVFLTVLGFGSGNYSDANMESIADAGNGNYFYIDSIEEAERVLCEKMKQTTVTVAKDVKFQLEFNPAEVAEYRQIGYENRQMSARDFSDDTKDGGEIGAGAQVTVCYELVLTGSGNGEDGGLKYQDTVLSDNAGSGELCTVSVRYKAPDEDESTLIEYPLKDNGISNKEDFNFICGVIEASMVIRDSEYKGNSTYDTAYQLAFSGSDNNKYREDFCKLLVKLGADG
ncbi:vWA domain-containing protein [Butyrivibrio sp. AE2032]|uniref:vWA domain-containing protein n=1 Tax=Butyrivibrio sp. AE2032 TaxID=1458463 RepID=UPI000691F98C|nr:von Willebrand factor type A domain-containing protein [Butyrivibrio sp. AE2032]